MTFFFYKIRFNILTWEISSGLLKTIYLHNLNKFELPSSAEGWSGSVACSWSPQHAENNKIRSKQIITVNQESYNDTTILQCVEEEKKLS